MTDAAGTAFGRYLRQLRHRGGLSLTGVSRSTQDGPHPVDKGALSRIEAGRQGLSLAGLATLSRLYRVRTAVITQRFELDAEAARSSRVRTTDDPPSRLVERGRRAIHEQNRKWDAYVFFREAVARECLGEDERAAAGARVNLATVIRSLGANDLALHELREELDRRDTPDGERPRLLDRMSQCHRSLGDFHQADQLSTAALEEARFHDNPAIAAHAHCSRAMLAMDRGDHREAIESLKAATAAYRRRPVPAGPPDAPPVFEASILLQLAEAFETLAAPAKAHRAARFARRMARGGRMPAVRAYADVLLGSIEDRQGQTGRARDRWNHALDTGRDIGNRRLAFVAQLELFAQARRMKQTRLAAGRQAALQRLAPWIPVGSVPYRRYLELTQ